MNKVPEVCDLVSITHKGVEYYGYIDDISFDMRDPGVKVEFFPGCSNWYGFDEIKHVEYPKDKLK